MTAETMKVPLILEQFALTEFSFRLVEPEEKSAVPPGNITLNYGLNRMDLPAPHKLVLKVLYAFSPPQSDGARFEVKATAVGFFKAHEELPEKERNHLLKHNGLAMLYGALRGLVLPFSGAFPPGVRCLLPTVNMVQVVEDAESGGKAGRHTGGAASPALRHKAKTGTGRAKAEKRTAKGAKNTKKRKEG